MWYPGRAEDRESEVRSAIATAAVSTDEAVLLRRESDSKPRSETESGQEVEVADGPDVVSKSRSEG